MSGYDRRGGRDGGRASGFSDGYGSRGGGGPPDDRGASRGDSRDQPRYDERGPRDDGYGYGRGGDDHGRSPYPPPPEPRGPPPPGSGGRRERPDSGFGDRDRADYGFDRRAPPTGNDGYGDQSKRARRDSPPRDRHDGDRGYGAYDRDRGYDDRRGPPRSPPRDSRSGAPPPSSGGRGGDGYGGGFDDRAPPPSSYDRGRGRDADYPPPPRGRDASRDREGGRDGQSGPPDQDEHQMEVPAEVAKIVIGSHGSAIKELQDRTGAHVMIYKPQPGARESGYRPVMIRGSRRSVDLATDELRRVVRDYEDGVVGGKDRRPPPSGDRGGYGGRGGFDDGYRGNDRGGRYDRYEDRGPPPGRGGGFDDRRGSFPPRHPSGPPGDPAEFVEENAPCPLENRGLVIGKGGKIVQRIEQETGVRISSQGDEPFLVIRGPATSVRNAKSQIASLLDAADMGALPESPPEGTPHALEVHVEREHIGRVMGYGGMTIKRAQADTGCVMKWDRVAQKIQLWGTPEIVEAGRRRIDDLVEEARVEIAKEKAEAVCVEVPTRGHTGFIIGARGVNVKRMEQETGARLRMDDRAQLMIITGKQHAVDRAARMVEEAVDKAEAIERGEGPPPGRR